MESTVFLLKGCVGVHAPGRARGQGWGRPQSCCKGSENTPAYTHSQEPAPILLQGSLGAHAAAAERAGSLGARAPLLERPASGSMMPGSFGGLPTRFTVTTGETFVLPPPPSAALPLPPAAGFQPPAGKVGL